MSVSLLPGSPPCYSGNSGAAAPEPAAQQRHHLLPFLLRCRGILQVKQVHGRALRDVPRTPSSSNRDFLFLYSRIIHFAASFSAAHLDYATRLLQHLLLLTDAGAVVLPPTSSYFWNTLIRAHARTTGQQLAALALYRCMLLDGRVPPDKYTIPFVLRACAFLFALPEGEQLHVHAVKLGLSADIYVANSLIHLYASCGRLDLASRIFDGMDERSAVSWNVIIDGFVVGGRYEDALKAFGKMQLSAFVPDSFTLQSLIGACEGLGTLSLGMWAHAFELRRCGGEVSADVLISNSLVDMYAKCGAIHLASQLFEKMPYRDVASWNAMILGFAMHGHVDEAMGAFERMQVADKLKPNGITFVGLLSACNHAGQVREGRKVFSSMSAEYAVEPQIEHYGCMVDLLARAGRIDEALELVSGMPCKPDAVIWRSLLDACWKANAGVDIGELMARGVAETEERSTSGVYVLLSRIYASASRWNAVGLVRKVMSEEGVRKVPGCSSIEMGGAVHEFVAGDTRHPRSEEIYTMLQVMEERVGTAGYSADLSQAPMVAEGEGEGKRQLSLRLHSERLAIAFGLLNKASPIRVFKNLRVCKDCHATTKLLSAAFGVEIIVRDRTRFHHFKGGVCSCADYW